MNYIGSKHSLRSFIGKHFDRIADEGVQTCCDLFAGTGAIGRLFKSRGRRVLANDIQYYAYVLNKAYLEINHPPKFVKLRQAFEKPLRKTGSARLAPVQAALALVQEVPGKPGFIAEHYSPLGKRFYYTQENAEKADAIRQTINEWRSDGLLSEREYFYILCSLLEAIDQVANTASVYGAYLKSFKRSAQRPLQLKPLELVNQVNGCKVFHEDANQLIERLHCDVLYLDPPYNHRQYGANYHVLETIARYDEPKLRGLTGMRDYPRSRYCQPKAAAAALEHLIARAQAKHIFVSYNDEGILSLKEVRDILSLRGKPQTFRQSYARFKADNQRQYKREATVEYLHYVCVTKT